ncbi:MAG: hypothetical protein QXL81_03465, partial [Candidatus Aenigmatarchaeota archaeon]
AILLVVIIAIVMAIAIISRGRFEALKGEAETVGAAGFIVSMPAPTNMSCMPEGGWVVDFGQFNITDPQRRNLTIIPILAFAGGKNMGFADSSGMAAVNIFGKNAGIVMLDSKGEARMPSLRFAKAGWGLGGVGAYPSRPSLELTLGLWIWTGETGCVYKGIFEKGLGATDMSDLLSYTAANCPELYIGTLHRNVTNPNCG